MPKVVRSAPVLTCLVTAVWAASAPAARGETIYLRDGRIVKGQLVERADGKLEITTKHGALIVEPGDVIRRENVEAPRADTATTDVVITTDGRVFSGNVSFSEETHEVVVSNDKFGETRLPRALIKTIRFRKGKEAPAALAQPAPGTTAPVSTEEDPEQRWRTQIDSCIARLRDPASDAKDRQKARAELLELGVFAVPYVREAIARIDSHETVVRPVLEDALRIAEMKAVVTGKMEEGQAGICERLVDRDENVRKKAINSAVLVDGEGAPPLLLHLVHKDPSSSVKALCVGQLALLKRYDELQQVLKVQEHGQLRFVAALELGEAGFFGGIPVIIEALKLDGDKFKDVRTTAIEALKRYVGRGNLGYLPEGDRLEREVAIKRWEDWWAAEGIAFARSHNVTVDKSEVSDEDRTRALDRWREGNRALEEVEKKQEAARKDNKKLDPKEVSYGFETAAYLFKQAIELDPSLCSARLSRAILLYERLAQPREAETQLKLVLNRFAPENARYLRVLATLHLGRIAELERNWKRAETCYLEVARLDETCYDAYVGLGDSWFERALAASTAPAPAPAPATPVERRDVPTGAEALPGAVKPAPSDEGEGGKPGPGDVKKQTREDELVHAMNAYKQALGAIDKRQRALVDTTRDLAGGVVGDLPVEDWKQGRLLTSIKDDRDSLVKRAADVWFRLGRVQAARGDKQEACEAFKAARGLDPADERYGKAAAIWEAALREGGP